MIYKFVFKTGLIFITQLFHPAPVINELSNATFKNMGSFINRLILGAVKPVCLSSISV